MSDEDTISLNTKGLDQIIKALKGKLPLARVGILGSSGTARSTGGVTNATVGAAHEFGTTTLPQRSFLRVPISENLSKSLEGSGAFDKDTLNEVIKKGSIIPWLKKAAAIAESVVLGAFDTGGYGKWKPSDMQYKKNGQTLVESGQLRNSIKSEVDGE